MNPYYEKYMREASQSAGAYSVYPFCPMCPWEDEKAKDQKRVQELYPALARQIQPLVEEACDRMEYDCRSAGSAAGFMTRWIRAICRRT